MKRITTRAILAVTLLTASAPALACPNCKEAVANQSPEESARLARGFSYSVVLMVSMPFLILGTGIVGVIRAVKRGALPEL